MCGEQMEYSKEVKYLKVTLDDKLKGNTYLEKVTGREQNIIIDMPKYDGKNIGS